MTSPQPTPPEPRSPDFSAELRERAWRQDVKKARDGIAGPLGIALFLGALYWLMEAKLGTGLFFFLVLSVAWVASRAYQWWKLRRRGPLTEAQAIDAHARSLAEALVLAQHRAALAARPTRLTWALLACIGAVTSIQLFAGGPGMIERAALVKPLVREGEWWRLLSSTYMHGGFLHFWFNFVSLRTLGPLVEAYAPRLRLPLVWLVSALGGSIASLLLMPHTTSVGASGGILGLVGYLWVMARRRPHELPAWLGRGLTLTLGINAALGIVGYAFIDNAAHAGGTVAGALFGFATIPRVPRVSSDATPAHRDESHLVLDALGVIAAFAIAAGTFMTIGKLLRL